MEQVDIENHRSHKPLPPQHLLPINEGLTEVPALERHQSYSHLRSWRSQECFLAIQWYVILACSLLLFLPASILSFLPFEFLQLASLLPLFPNQSDATPDLSRRDETFSRWCSAGRLPGPASFSLFLFMSPCHEQRKWPIFIGPQLLSFFLSLCLCDRKHPALPTSTSFIQSIHSSFLPTSMRLCFWASHENTGTC